MAPADIPHAFTSDILIKAGGYDFLVSNEMVSEISEYDARYKSTLKDEGPWLLATVAESPHDGEDLESVLEGLARNHLDDHIWTIGFLKVIVLRFNSVCDLQSIVHHKSSIIISTTQSIPYGAYAIDTETGCLHSFSRLIEDKFQAFIGSCVQISDKNSALTKFRSLNFNGRIAVPVRHPLGWYEQHSGRPSLAGLRFAVKDIIDVSGLKTGFGNRSFRDIYQSKEHSSHVVNTLLFEGATLVGKLKLAQFADGQDPAEWFDYQAPFNPRGDGYQKPSSSSTGSAVACAGYPWLDFTLGTDTGGSIRHPAGVNGVYGYRPSFGSVDDEGVCSVSRELDTVGIFARSPKILEKVGAAISKSAKPVEKQKKRKFKLLYPQRSKGNPENLSRWFPYPDEHGSAPEAEAVLEAFVEKLESHLGTTRQPFNFEELWKSTRPAEESESLDEATGKIYTALVYYNALKETIDPFIKDYQDKSEGRKPWIDPIIRQRFDAARDLITEDKYRDAVKAAETFRYWVNEYLFAFPSPSATGDENMEEIPILIYPQSLGRPDYRNAAPNPVTKKEDLFFSAFSTYSISYLGGGPDITVPVGEIEFLSKVTGIKEYLPVSVSMLARKGQDGVLLKLLRDLEESEVLKEVAAGRRVFTDQEHA